MQGTQPVTALPILTGYKTSYPVTALEIKDSFFENSIFPIIQTNQHKHQTNSKRNYTNK